MSCLDFGDLDLIFKVIPALNCQILTKIGFLHVISLNRTLDSTQTLYIESL